MLKSEDMHIVCGSCNAAVRMYGMPAEECRCRNLHMSGHLGVAASSHVYMPRSILHLYKIPGGKEVKYVNSQYTGRAVFALHRYVLGWLHFVRGPMSEIIDCQ